MVQALYRKYRPVRFADLVGQNHIKITLQNELEQDRVAHAYLFSGPRGIGKTTTARLLAKAVNCQDKKGAEACEKCDFCQEISQGKSMDVIEIDAASHTGVDNVRENIIENSRFTPQRLKYKVFIIDEVHMLSLSAFNALLKTLEEPPEHVIFIMATTEIHRVPETIISRCQRFDFKRVSVEELVKRMSLIATEEGVQVEDALLENVAHRSEGSVRDAEVLLTQLISLGEKEITLEKAELIIPRSSINQIVELFEQLVSDKRGEAITLISKLIEDGVNIQDFTKDLIDFMRRILILKSSGSIKELEILSIDENKLKQIKKITEKLTLAKIIGMIDILIRRNNEIKYSNIIQLPLELAVLEIVDNDKIEINIDDDDNNTPVKPEKPEKVVQQKKIKKESTATQAETKIDKEVKGKSKMKESVPKSALFEKIKEFWPEIIKELKEHNHSISMTMKVGVPVSLDDNILTIGFRYKFHEERIEEVKIKTILENYFEGKYKKKIIIQTALLAEEKFNELSGFNEAVSQDDKVWDDAVQDLGGELVEEEID
ncbi:MAG: DNA polymerase III subunit gamma/tau [bacterium]|nr:DNA polymerase III subunit gamma/tau [bacterium]